MRQLVQAAPRTAAPLPGWLERLTSLGIVADDAEVVRRQRFTNMFALASAGNLITHVAVFCLYDLAGLAYVIAADVVFFAAMLAVPLLHQLGDNLGAHTLSALSIVAILFSLVVLGRDSQVYVYFSLSGIILFMFGVENARSWLPWFATAFVGLAVFLPLSPALGLVGASDPLLQRIVSTHSMINVAVVNALIIYFVLSTLRRTEIALEDQHRRAAALLSSLLPESIVGRLTTAPERSIADRIDGLSVLFADLAGFTNAARSLPPEQIVGYLDDMVRAFDALCAETGAEKIKTIGDSYMAVGGLSGDARSGALAIGRLALAMVAEHADRSPLGGVPLSLRIGIHTGSATAGIIGDTRFSYDVWGDAVNIASRIESHGVPGRIHVSAAYRDAAGGAFGFEERGEIEIRSVGPARTFFLVSQMPRKELDGHFKLPSLAGTIGPSPEPEGPSCSQPVPPTLSGTAPPS